jgi:hypothetical protein
MIQSIKIWALCCALAIILHLCVTLALVLRAATIKPTAYSWSVRNHLTDRATSLATSYPMCWSRCSPQFPQRKRQTIQKLLADHGMIEIPS